MKTTRTIARTSGILMVLGGLIMLGGSCQSGKTSEESSTGESAKIQSKQGEVPETDLHTAAVLGDLDAVKAHIEAGTDLDVMEPTAGSSPLITAAVFGKTEVARALVEAGAKVNYQNREGSSALHTAAFLCRTEIVKLLLAKGADRELKNIFGSTALQSVEGPFEAVKPIYDLFSTNLGPLGLKLDYGFLEETRPVIAQMLRHE